MASTAEDDNIRAKRLAQRTPRQDPIRNKNPRKRGDQIMVKYVIEVFIQKDDILVLVSRNKRYYDEVEFHPSESDGFIEYMRELAEQILREEKVIE